jgi:hypothetical protein
MFELDSGHDYFCCEQGQYGVLPVSGYAGICEPIDQPVASSRIATSVSQAGSPAPATGVVVQPGTTGTVTSTLQNGGVTTILTTIPASTATGAVSQTGTGGGAGSTAAGQSSGSGNSVSLSKGALIAIIVCAIAVPIACLIIFFVFWRKRRAGRGGEGPFSGNSGGVMYAPPQQQVEKSPGNTYVAPYAEEQHEYGKSELPPSEAPPGSSYVVSPAVESPATLGRIEMG